jgi:acetylornithine deacetylase/succinyl-diaminopimelate desuccinylase-like protein
MYEKLREQSAACRDDVVAFLQRLVRTRSFSFGEEAAAGIVHDTLDALGYDLVFRDEVGNVVGLLAGTEDGPAVLLASRMDTRRPDEGDAGEDGLFSGRIEEGRLRGIGATACKGGLAAQVYAAHLLDRSLLPFSGTIVVAATVAQEEGNGAGARHLLSETLPKLGIAPSLAILGEPTSLAPCNGHDGWVDVAVEIAASDSAAARRAAAAVRDALSRATAGRPAPSAARASRPFGAETTGRTGSSVESIVLRLPVKPGEDPADLVGLVKTIARAAAEPIPGADVEARVHGERRRFYTGRPVEFLSWITPWSTDPSNPLVERALEGLSAAGWVEAEPRAWRPDDLRTGSAGSLFVDGFGVPALCFGPGDEDRTRTPDESVAIENVARAVFGTAALVHGALGAPLPPTAAPGEARGKRGGIPTGRSRE